MWTRRSLPWLPAGLAAELPGQRVAPRTRLEARRRRSIRRDRGPDARRACYAAGLAHSPTPEQVYERNWALALLERTTARLASEFESAGKSPIFECLKPYLGGDRQAARYAQVAAALGMSEVAVRVAVHRMRGRFSDLLRQEVASTLESRSPPTPRRACARPACCEQPSSTGPATR